MRKIARVFVLVLVLGGVSACTNDYDEIEMETNESILNSSLETDDEGEGSLPPND